MINFVNPRSPFLIAENCMPPLGLFSMVSVLKRAGIDAQVIDLALGDMIPPGPIFITGTTAQLGEMMKLKGRGYTVVGGPHASMNAESLIEHFDCVVVGEGEDVILDIVKNKPSGIIQAKRIKDLDRLPFPDRTTAGRYDWKINGKRATTMMTSRGCTGRCSFCCKAVMHKGIYFRSAQSVIDECIHLKALGFEAIMFYDDSIMMDADRLFEICAGIKRLGLTWRCFGRSDQVKYNLIKQMANAGCHEILFGVESGSQKILDNIRKDESPEQHLEAIRLAKLVGIKTKALMIAGLPGETRETIEESRKFILEARPDSLDVTILSVYAGCDIHKHPERYDIEFSEPKWYKGRNDEYESTVRTSHLNEDDIVMARDSLWKTFLSTK